MIVEFTYEVSCTVYSAVQAAERETVLRHRRSEPGVGLRGSVRGTAAHSSHPHHCQISFNYNTLIYR